MPFSTLKLHPSLLKGVKELGFTRPTPIQTDAIPPALAGRDVLACATTGSGKTAAFLLPILHQLIDKPRGTTRALVLTPTRELAAQILDDLNDLAVHTPISAAAVFGGVGMGPQEHAFRSGVDVIIATPGRLLDHFRMPYAKLAGLEHLVLDEADRMLDMGFLPDIRACCATAGAATDALLQRHDAARRSRTLTREMLHDPATINLARRAAPAVGITQAVYPVAQELKQALLRRAARARRDPGGARLHAHQAPRRPARDAPGAQRRSKPCASTATARSRSAPRRSPASRSGKYRVLVATDIAARGIDVEALGHVVNFDVPLVPEDYIHRVGRTARAELTGEAFTFVSPDEQSDLRAHRARDRQAPAARHGARLRLQREAEGKPRSVDRRAHRADPRAQGARARPLEAERRAPRRGPPGRGRRTRPGAVGASQRIVVGRRSRRRTERTPARRKGRTAHAPLTGQPAPPHRGQRGVWRRRVCLGRGSTAAGLRGLAAICWAA